MELAASLATPIEYIPLHGGRSAFGIKADLVSAVCDVWLRAREANAPTMSALLPSRLVPEDMLSEWRGRLTNWKRGSCRRRGISKGTP